MLTYTASHLTDCDSDLMLLQEETTRFPSAPLSAARTWVNGLYARLHEGAPLETAVNDLGDLLQGQIELVRIVCMDTGAVTEWRRAGTDFSGAQHELNVNASFQRLHGERCLSLFGLEAQPDALLMTLTSPQCEILVGLRLVVAPTVPRSYGEIYAEMLLFTLPQLAQVSSLLGRLRQPLRNLETVHSLLQLVPLPLIALNNENTVVSCNRSTRSMVLRMLGDQQETLPVAMIQPGDCRALKFDAVCKALLCQSLTIPATHLFDEQWGRQPVSIFGVQDCRDHPQLNAPILTAIYQFSSAEIGVCEWVLAGKEPADIAVLQNRSINTIKSQLRSIYRKTGVQNTAQLARRLFFNPAYWVGR